MAYIGTPPSSAVVTVNQLADNVITSAKISDNAVSTSELADYSVTNTKLANATASSFATTGKAIAMAMVFGG